MKQINRHSKKYELTSALIRYNRKDIKIGNWKSAKAEYLTSWRAGFSSAVNILVASFLKEFVDSFRELTKLIVRFFVAQYRRENFKRYRSCLDVTVFKD